MSTINNINPTDRISDSRSVINDNFSNLNTDKAEKTDIQKNTYNYALATGSGNAFAVTLDPAPTVYTIGMKVAFKANHTITGAATLNVNSLGAKTIKKNGEFDLEANDMEVDKIYEVIYDGTYFQLLSQLAKKQEEKDLKAFAQSPPSLTLRVTKGAVNIDGTIVYYAGGSSPTFTVPTTNPRIDLLVLNNSGTLEIIQGTEAASPSAPTYPTDKFVICEVYNRVSQTVIKNENDGVNGYIQKDIRVNKEVAVKFGGDGSDGALSISSGVTNIDLGGAAVFEKNYSSISITGTGKLTFSNPHPYGTIIILKSKGDVTLTSSTVPCIDVSGLGGEGSAAVYSYGNWVCNSAGKGYCGSGGSPVCVEYEGNGAGGGNLTVGTGGRLAYYRYTGSGIEIVSANPRGGIGAALPPLNKYSLPLPGGGGSGGIYFSPYTGSAGGNGGGALLIECLGALNFTGTIWAKGNSAATADYRGGGGAGGSVVIIYNTLTANTGTIDVSGGTGGNNGSVGQSLVQAR